MMGKMNVRLLVAVAPAVVLGLLAIIIADRVEPASTRFILQFIAIGAVADLSWRVGAAALGGTITRAHGLPGRLKLIATDHRRRTFDRETGLHAEWYFRLRIEEEIARSKRYRQPFTVIVLASPSRQALDAVRVTMKQWLRETDYAGDLSDILALCLPNTRKTDAENVTERLTALVEGIHVSLAEYPLDGETVAALLGEGDSRTDGIRASVA
jgi:GGDEF domain-containing protein